MMHVGIGLFSPSSNATEDRMIQSLARRWFLLGFLLVSGCCAAGDNLYICLASPSEFAVDAAADAQGMTDASFELGADLPNMDDHQLVDMPDMGMPTVDVIDVPVVAQDTLIEDVSDAMSADLVDASDVPGVVDVPVLMDVATIDRFDAGTIDAPDVVLIDMPDVPALVDVGFDRPVVDTGTDVQMVDTVDAPARVDMPDVPPPPPELVFGYVTVSGGDIVPHSGVISQIRYSFGDRVSAFCSAVRLAGANYRCVAVPTLSVAQRTASRLYFVVPDACGSNTDQPICPSTWVRMWSVEWLGRRYTSDDMIMTDAGSVPAITMLNRDVCDAQMGYYNPCLSFTIPR